MRQPIFIVGASRSGTELMRCALNLHPSVFIAPETHYFDDLRPRLRGREQTGLTAREASRCEDYLLATLHRPYGQGGWPDKAPISRETLRHLATQIGSGADAFFEAFCQLCASHKGADRWGEKTPRHVFCLSDILAVFPRSKIICMVRDPRGVIASYRDKNKNYGAVANDTNRTALAKDQQRFRRSYNLLIACLLWSGSVQAALEARAQFTAECIYIQRYEDLVLDAPSVLARLARWLSIDYCPSMLNVPNTNSSYDSVRGASGFAKEIIDRWRTKLSQYEISAIQTICLPMMRCAGYEFEPVHASLYPLLWEALKFPAAAINAAFANFDRIGAIGPYLHRRLLFAGRSLIKTNKFGELLTSR